MSIIFFPLIGSLIAGLGGWYIGQYGSMFVTTAFMILACLLSFYAFYEIGLNGNVFYYTLSNWIKSGTLSVNWGFLFDPVTAVMLIVVTTVSLLVHIYSCGYMSHDPHVSRFMSYLSLFTFFMLMLITSDNFVQLFLGWEGVGLCSYLLISFWFTRPQANKSALKALLMNRIGDCGLLFAIGLIFYTFQTVDFETVFELAPNFIYENIYLLGYNINVITVITLLLFLGAVGKSAQIGLHTWLPDAMEGPTPVSALIHAATMVTAGVFLLIRCSPLFELSHTSLFVVVIIGATTSIFAATVGLVQNDIKKIIAYSTCSQLGYMVFICGLSGYNYGLFHLTTHAFFKALLFLSAGSIIHGLSNEQDIRRMGGLTKIFPLTYGMFFIGTLALIGFPFLAGFYSKDAILELAFANYTISGHFAYWVGSLAAFCTSFYSFRLLYFVFYSKNASYKPQVISAHESSVLMALPLLLLSLGSIFSGYILKDALIGQGSSFFQDSITVLFVRNKAFEAELIPIWIKLLPTILTIIGATSAYLVNSRLQSTVTTIQLNNVQIYRFFNKKWYFDYLYNIVLAYPALTFFYDYVYKMTDKGIIELFGPTGITKVIYSVSKYNRSLHTGIIYQYLSLIFLTVVAVLTIIQLFY